MTSNQIESRTERLRAKAIADASLAMRGGSESAIMVHAQMSDEWQAASYIEALETCLSEMVKGRDARGVPKPATGPATGGDDAPVTRHQELAQRIIRNLYWKSHADLEELVCMVDKRDDTLRGVREWLIGVKDAEWNVPGLDAVLDSIGRALESHP